MKPYLQLNTLSNCYKILGYCGRLCTNTNDVITSLKSTFYWRYKVFIHGIRILNLKTPKAILLKKITPYILDMLSGCQAKIMKVRMWLKFSFYVEWNVLCQLWLDNLENVLGGTLLFLVFFLHGKTWIYVALHKGKFILGL